MFLLLSKFSEPQLFTCFIIFVLKGLPFYLPAENNPTLLPYHVIRDHDERNENENCLLSACPPELPHALPSLQLIAFLWRRYAWACTVAVCFPTPWGAPEEGWAPPSSSSLPHGCLCPLPLRGEIHDCCGITLGDADPSRRAPQHVMQASRSVCLCSGRAKNQNSKGISGQAWGELADKLWSLHNMWPHYVWL